MRISEYIEFIGSFPYLNQSFDIKKENWKTKSQEEEISNVFDENDTITLNRNDLINSRFNIPTFIIRTLMWGYRTKGRGNNIENILQKNNFEFLVKVLEEYKDGNIHIEQMLEDVNSIKGLGISTMTKFTTFLNTEINGCESVILDNQIMSVIDSGKFEELNHLNGIGNKKKTYLPYIKTISDLAKMHGVNPNQIELFLFTFGNNLSELKGESY